MVVFQNCMVSVKGEPGLCSEMYITPSNDEIEEVNTKVEEVIYIKEEDVPEAIACPLIETEPEVRVCARVCTCTLVRMCICLCMYVHIGAHVICVCVHVCVGGRGEANSNVS
jgi:hypothetical protein